MKFSWTCPSCGSLNEIGKGSNTCKCGYIGIEVVAK